MIKTCICKNCSSKFQGGPRAWYCPDCRIERRRQRDIQHKRRKRAGKTRPIGSSDTCIVCGKLYTVMGGLQKYCKKCAPKAIAEIDRRQGMEYYLKNREKNNPIRNRKKEKEPIACAVCGKDFKEPSVNML